MKHLSTMFAIIALILSHIMCAVVAYNYCALQWGGRYEAWSFPAWSAFMLAIPYSLAIACCILLAVVFKRKHHT